MTVTFCNLKCKISVDYFFYFLLFCLHDNGKYICNNTENPYYQTGQQNCKATNCEYF